ncbi:hypothetical protein D9758_001847 [Tetrapyrgos nigripes]|uniref:Uncharacterized protein n=1 Tax=Tetrapyrgos nigripes TaxID=182062 RepID=A0A8H5GU04_9AGAR|nr:hypothetical protein D9758_001847 [Tetrapyrgos nigripes]
MYSGVVTDVEPPSRLKPFTELLVNIPQLGQVIGMIKHDDVYHILGKLLLQDAIPLRPEQQHLQQIEWTHEQENPLEPSKDAGDQVHCHELVPKKNFVPMSTSPEPWINKIVNVVKGPFRHQGTVRGVQRTSKYTSGLCITVCFDQVFLVDHGVGHKKAFDYDQIRDNETGLALHQAYPLWKSRRYYQSLTLKLWKAMPRAIRSITEENRPVTPPTEQLVHDGSAWDLCPHLPL